MTDYMEAVYIIAICFLAALLALSISVIVWLRKEHRINLERILMLRVLVDEIIQIINGKER